MKEEIKINIYPNPTKANPESYRMAVKYKDKESGEIKQTFPRWKNEREAKKQATQWTLDYAKNKGFFAPLVIEPEPVKVLTFREYAESYAVWKINEIKSVKTFNGEMKKLIDRFGKMPLAAIDYDEIKLFRSELETPIEKKVTTKSPFLTLNPETNRMRYEKTTGTIETRLSDSSVNLFIKRLKNIMYSAWRSGKVTEHPQKLFHKAVKPEENKPTTAITFGEFEQLLSVCNEERKHLYLQVLCIFEAACRKSECKAIRKRDLNIETGFCWVNISKQKKNAKQRPPRRCYFSKRLIAAIIADGFDDKSPDDFLFDTGDYKRSWATALRLAFRDTEDIERREKLLDLDLQRSLRKSARIHYNRAGMLENVIDYQMSHAPTTTGRKHYDDVTEEEQLREFERYEEFSAAELAKFNEKAMTAVR